MRDVVSKLLEVDAGTPLVEVARRCHLLSEYSKILMKCRMMSLGTDVVLHEVTMFSMRHLKVLLRTSP